ncbi:CBS domain-containing protein [Nonomuraea basaltis]|uniref:CBS domain-containing protein n=1 Tax=Nonomuraea basaltis TaxID=2495887 RepID=UPI00110C49D2|nr:CBS domain-containing protein [Nonomuraea basaltis]TMR90152.1 CBS domain-containing protein [Nonomuraea basaltis]
MRRLTGWMGEEVLTMKRTHVHEVMTADVVTVRVTTSLTEIVALLYTNGISGVPVLDWSDRVCGVISGADLAGRQTTDAPTDNPWAAPAAGDLRSPHLSKTALGLMTAPALTIDPLATAEAAVRMLARHRIGRLPVVDTRTKRLTGIVTRSDLLQIRSRPDVDIKAEITLEVLSRMPGLDPHDLGVWVRNGVVTVHGQLERRSAIAGLVEGIGQIEGVVRVVESIDCDINDAAPAPAQTIQWGG